MLHALTVHLRFTSDSVTNNINHEVRICVVFAHRHYFPSKSKIIRYCLYIIYKYYLYFLIFQIGLTPIENRR